MPPELPKTGFHPSPASLRFVVRLRCFAASARQPSRPLARRAGARRIRAFADLPAEP